MIRTLIVLLCTAMLAACDPNPQPPRAPRIAGYLVILSPAGTSDQLHLAFDDYCELYEVTQVKPMASGGFRLMPRGDRARACWWEDRDAIYAVTEGGSKYVLKRTGEDRARIAWLMR